jgi:hypothetical protein
MTVNKTLRIRTSSSTRTTRTRPRSTPPQTASSSRTPRVLQQAWQQAVSETSASWWTGWPSTASSRSGSAERTTSSAARSRGAASTSTCPAGRPRDLEDDAAVVPAPGHGRRPSSSGASTPSSPLCHQRPSDRDGNGTSSSWVDKILICKKIISGEKLHLHSHLSLMGRPSRLSK